MAKVLTITHSGDVHADAVSWALKRRGDQMVIWNHGNFPAEQKASVRVSGTGTHVSYRDRERYGNADDCDVVWLRRTASPSISQQLPDGDRKIAARESLAFRQAGLALMAPRARWINPVANAAAANIKPWQLHQAARAGLRIPETLSSNDPVEVRAFAKQHANNIIYKPFHPASWTSGNKAYVAETSFVSRDLLNNDFAIQAAPGIYQSYVKKKYELRVTWMGRSYLAVRLSNPGCSELPVDIKPAIRTLEAIEVKLSEDTEAACLRLMKSLGIVFGCIDLLITEANETLFLEVNEMGQFLWVEDLNDSIPMLSVFTDFVSSGNPDFTRSHPATGEQLSMKQYLQSQQSRMFSTEQIPATSGSQGFGVAEPS